MKIAQNQQQCNPEQISSQLDGLLEKLKTDVQSAATQGDSFDTVERIVLSTVLQLGHQALELLVAMQGDGDLGPQIETDKGKTIRRSQTKASTQLRSIFGNHAFEQFTYASGKNKAIQLKPISARLSLPANRWSFLLQEFSQMLGADQAYDQAMKNLGKILDSNFSVDTAERINASMGKSAGEFLHDLPAPEPDSEGKLLVATADCKGVPLVKQDSAKVAAFETAKKNPGNRRMATVTSVYSVDRYRRTAEEITAALFRDDPSEDRPNKPDRPVPQNKITTAHFPEVEDNGNGQVVPISGIHVGMAWLMVQAIERRRPGQVLIALMDGQESLWDTMQLHVNFSARTVPILDILHALAYVWEAAGLFEREESSRREFTRVRLLKILGGEVMSVVRSLRALGTRRGFSGEKLKSLGRITNYLSKNAARMKYDEYLRRGYPIASGVIEGACRHLVKDRMERSGMRWTLEGARSMLNVRAAFQSDHWESFLKWNKDREIAQTHPNRQAVAAYSPPNIAC